MLHVTEVTPVSLSYLMLGGFVVTLSMISLVIKDKLYIGEATIGTAFGIIIGPHVSGVFDPTSWGSNAVEKNKITLEFMRIVLATGLFAIGVELPKAYLKEHARSLLFMVVPTMAFGWLVVGGIIKALFPSLSFVSALVISACLTPTDPILSAAICGGSFAIKHVPLHIRQLLVAESAANDGLAYPFLSISIYLAVETSKQMAFGKWFLVGWLYQVIMGTTLGTVIGWIFSKVMNHASDRKLLDNESFVAQYLALALFTVGVANSLGSDDLLAAFAAGSAVSWDGRFNTETEDQVFSHVIDFVFNCACFIYIGAWLPFQFYDAPEIGLSVWKLVVLLLFVLAMRRVPCLFLLYKIVPDIHNVKEALFCGHFGPMGVGAVFISTFAISELPVPSSYPPSTQNELLSTVLHPIVSFIVLGSIVIHGLSIPIFWYGRKGLRRAIPHVGSLARKCIQNPLSVPRTSSKASSITLRSTYDDVEIGLKDLSKEPRIVVRSRSHRGNHRSQAGVNNVPCATSSPVFELPSSNIESIQREIQSIDGMSGRVVEDSIGDGSGEEVMVSGPGLASLHPAKENKGQEEPHPGQFSGIKNPKVHISSEEPMEQ